MYFLVLKQFIYLITLHSRTSYLVKLMQTKYTSNSYRQLVKLIIKCNHKAVIEPCALCIYIHITFIGPSILTHKNILNASLDEYVKSNLSNVWIKLFDHTTKLICFKIWLDARLSNLCIYKSEKNCNETTFTIRLFS